jgi:hypothetical protein
VNRKDFQDLADVRVAEAEALLQGTFFDGAYYLAGYAVECALKACIAKQTQAFDYPPKNGQKYYTHRIKELVGLAGLEVELDLAAKADLVLGSNWAFVLSWTEESRYDRKDQADAEALFKAITDSSHGVLPWIKARW